MSRILIIDDDEGMLMGLQYACENTFDAVFVNSGAKAIALCRDQFFDLIITDLQMPGLNGQETIKGIKQFNPNQRVAVMSGFSDLDAKKECQSLGVTRFLSKNLNTADFIEWVNEALGSA